METASPAQHPWLWPRTLLDVLLRAGLLAILAVACYRVFQPFLDLMVWAVILAVTLNPLQGWVRRHLHWREGHIATLIVVLIILVLLVPVYFIAMSIAGSAHDALEVARSGNVHVPPPSDAVRDWPIVGERLHALWTQAASDLTSLARKFAPQLRTISFALLGKLAGVALGLLFIGPVLLAVGYQLFWAWVDAMPPEPLPPPVAEPLVQAPPADPDAR